MAYAWKQVDQILEANRDIYRTQLAKESVRCLHHRNLLDVEPDKALHLTSTVHKRILINDSNGTATPKLRVKESTLPDASQTTNFRKISRTNGKISVLANNEIANASVSGQFQDLLITNLNAIAQPDITAAVARPNQAGSVTNSGTSSTMYTTQNFITGAQSSNEASYPVNTPSMDANIANLSYNIPNDQYNHAANHQNPVNTNELDIDYAQADSLPKLIADVMEPTRAIPRRLDRRIASVHPELQFDKNACKPLLASPHFEEAMYKAVKDISADFILPNIDMVPENSITLLEANPEFIESFMVGLNHEMARELLWREYPTDQRGSFFKQFWEIKDFVNVDGTPADDLEEQLWDISDIARDWEFTSSLGHSSHTAFGNPNAVVLLVRGDLLKKYPNTVIYAQQAGPRLDGTGYPPHELLGVDDSNAIDPVRKYPIYSAQVEPDITFFGFDLTTEDVRSGVTGNDYEHGWYFVLQEREGEVRFGFDIHDTGALPEISDWNEVTWGHVDPSANGIFDPTTANSTLPGTLVTGGPSPTGIDWGKNSADLAYIMYQLPVRVAVHADKMLKNIP